MRQHTRQQRFWWRRADDEARAVLLRVSDGRRPVRTAVEPDELLGPPPARRSRPAGRRRGMPWVLAFVTAGALIFAGATGFGRQARLVEPLTAQLDQALVAAGFNIGEVVLAGHKFTTDAEIYGALALDRAGSIIAYDVAGARRRIEALAWVLKADVKRVLPDGLAVTIEERRPVAVWEHEGKAHLVDRSGRVLANLTGTTGRLALMQITGEAAPAAVGALLAALEPFGDIAGRLAVAHRVGGRRWTLELNDGGKVLLPAERDGEALLRLSRHQEASGILNGGGQTIDLRQDGMIAISGSARVDTADAPARRPPL